MTDEGQPINRQLVLTPKSGIFQATPWLPLGGKLLAKRGDEGQSINRQLVSTSKSDIFQTAVLAFPFGESGERMRVDRGQFKIITLCQGFPLGQASLVSQRTVTNRCKCYSLPLIQATLCLHKIVSHSVASPRGESSSQSEVMRGSRLTASLFLTPRSGISQTAPRFPLRESLPNCRSKASSASKVASVCESIEVRLNFSRCSPPYEKNPTARRRIQLFCPVSVL